MTSYLINLQYLMSELYRQHKLPPTTAYSCLFSDPTLPQNADPVLEILDHIWNYLRDSYSALKSHISQMRLH